MMGDIPVHKRVTTLDESELRIHELAELLIARRGEKAMTFARYEALKANRRGEPLVSEMWFRIADATEQFWRVEPTAPAEAPHAAPAQVVLREDRGLRRRLGAAFSMRRARSTT